MISGFTLVRNAQILDYPFEESVRSILPLCDEFIINCGDSEDETLKLCLGLKKESSKIRVIQSTWERKNQKGGFQLKKQTDLALVECKNEWCFYLQADEVIHEEDWPILANAISSAPANIDGILFDYLHFYGSYDYIIKGRNWYRKEVRLFRNHRNIAAFRDAQGFRIGEQRLLAFPSKARVFHYGCVRDAHSYHKKTAQMTQWWGEPPVTDPELLKPSRDVGIRKFMGTHPQVMLERIRLSPITFDPDECPRHWNWGQIKNALTLGWEFIFRTRIGEFRNYRC